jgi:DNA-binding transcriptional regulator YhcF (GntR family)
MPRTLELQVDRELDLPIGAQLAIRLRGLIEDGTIRPGDRLPSIRELAADAGVNVNTVRAVYRRLEQEGLVATEHGRGTFVVDEAALRRRLRSEIAALERELVRHGPIPPPSDEHAGPRSALLSARELAEVRDVLVARLEELDAVRVEILARLEELKAWEEQEEAASRREGAKQEDAGRQLAYAAMLRRLKGPLTSGG